ncbi:MAG: DUF1697 domain-containing protein [Longimicrobiales bacterium]
MAKHIAFLRAINVGGHNVKMDVLRDLFDGAGFAQVETFIASGNVIFDSSRRDTAKLESDIEKMLRSGLGYEVSTFIRSPAEVAAVATHEPFGKRAAGTGLYVGFMAGRVSSAGRDSILAFRTDVDDFHVHGREVYWQNTGRSSDSKFSNATMERALKCRATFRNITTVTKLAAKYAI